MSNEDAHTICYAIDPREVREVVEKSSENRPCDAKCGKYGENLGDRPEEVVREILSA